MLRMRVGCRVFLAVIMSKKYIDIIKDRLSSFFVFSFCFAVPILVALSAFINGWIVFGIYIAIASIFICYPTKPQEENQVLFEDWTTMGLKLENNAPQQTQKSAYTPQPQLSNSERLLKEYEEKQYLKAEEIGRRYERYIGYLYEIDGYKVDYNGIKKGVKDGGVDLICSKRKELVIIQCKCRDDQGQIHENTILQLIANLMKYKRKYPNKNVSAVIYTSHDNLDDEAKATLADEVANGALIHHIIKAYDNSYPKVKCNISDNGEKIYHIPDHSSTYDRIQIEINKGEFFAKTIKEAESAGFRASKA